MLRPIPLAVSLLTFVLTAASTGWTAGVLEVPGAGSTLSGVLFASGWKCPRQGRITIVFDDRAPLQAAAGLPRGDTAQVCSNGGNNGFLAQFNYALLGEGEHVARALDEGVEFARATFTVATLGTNFLRGASGAYRLDDFPSADESVVVEWNQGVQNFVITEHDTAGPAECPTNGPIRDLTDDCSEQIYFYQRNALVAGLITDGSALVICAASTGDDDILCYGGFVTSAVDFDLAAVNLNGGPFVPLDAGSAGALEQDGEALSFTVVLEGEVFPFSGLAFIGVEPAAAADVPASSEEASSRGERLSEALRSALVATAVGQGRDVASASSIEAGRSHVLSAVRASLRDAERE